MHFFSYWVRSSSVGLLSLFFPFKGRSETTSSVCLSLSLSYEARAFWKTRSPSRMLRGTQKERGTIISEKEEIDYINSRAKAGKKKMDWISSHRAEPQPQRVVVASKTKTHIYPRTNLCYLPSAPAGHASKIHSSPVPLIYMCVYILSDLFDKRVRIYICALLCSKTHEYEM